MTRPPHGQTCRIACGAVLSRPARAARPQRSLPAPQWVYCRCRDLPKLLPIDTGALSDGSKAGRSWILSRLRRALRSERQRGLAGHWTYDLARHVQLRRALDAEQAADAEAERAP